jgi:hypothetical protein
MDVLNIDCFKGPEAPKWLAMARGMSVDEAGMGSFNGGILNPMREHLKVGQYYYRFVSKSTPLSRKVGGMWWMDSETLINIHRRFVAAGPDPMARQSSGPGAAARSTFREWLALTFEWNLIEEVIIGQLRARLDSYSGFGRQAQGGHAFDNRKIGMAPHLQNLFTIKQHFVPEFYKHQKVAMPNYRIVDFARIEDVVAARVI